MPQADFDIAKGNAYVKGGASCNVASLELKATSDYGSATVGFNTGVGIVMKAEDTNMAIIQVTPALLQSKSTEVRKLKGEQEQVIQRLTQLVNGLSEIWKGEAQDAFVAKYHSMESTFKNFSEMLEGYAKLMDTAARELQSTDQTLKGTMNNFD